MDELVYPRERTLGKVTLVLGSLIWLGLLIGTMGGLLIGLAIGFLAYVFAQSTLIAYIKGNGVELSEAQFPDLYEQFKSCCAQLGIKNEPQAFVLNGGGSLNAFATKFLGAQYVVLLSDVVDAMDKHPDGVRFYMGHELGHLRMNHLRGQLLRWPVLWLPLVGAAYSRAKESTCDRHGRACCATPDGAARALGALAAGSKRWQSLSISNFRKQAHHSKGFWMSFHELTGSYPWLTKRVTRVIDATGKVPSRHPLAYVLAAFVPYAGRLGGGFGVLILVYMVGVMAAVALPAYQDYKTKAELVGVVSETQDVLMALGRYYQANQKVPDGLETAGLPPVLRGGARLSLDARTMILTVHTPRVDLVFTPEADTSGNIGWSCAGGEGVRATQLPPNCRAAGSQVLSRP